jgi:hypothetical protein
MSERTAAIQGLSPREPQDAPPRLLEIDAQEFRTCFNRRPFLIRHRLADHPLFSLRRLVELSRRLPEESVKYNGADITIETPLYHGPRTGLSTEDTIRQIEEAGSWMVLKNVEVDPEYRELLDRCLDEIRVHSEATYPSMRQREAFIFVSSPSAVTPYHMDPEHNFLLQIRGTKRLHIWDGWDRSVLSERELEEYFAGNEKQLVFKEEYREKAAPFDLVPGLAVHVPIATPHWVQNGDQVSISFSITFQSHRSERQQFVHRVNQRLRSLGMSPRPFAASSAIDSFKYASFVSLRAIKRLFAGGR